MKLSDLNFLILKKKLFKAPLEIKIISGSMEPLIKVDETVIVEKVKSKDLKPFDVVIYHAEDKRLICHFIWGKSEINANNFLFGALNGSTRLDLPVPEQKILGIVVNKKITLFHKTLLLVKRITR